MNKTPRIAAFFLAIAGAIMIVAGGLTWVTVSSQLAAENITVTQDAKCQQGEKVNGPIEAYCMADIINTHALKATGNKTYAQLDREDPLRTVAMNGSFLRASLFTSVVAFGIAAMAMGLGVVLMVLGAAVGALDRRTAVKEVPDSEDVSV